MRTGRFRRRNRVGVETHPNINFLHLIYKNENKARIIIMTLLRGKI
jgi:hypothetical protein